MRHKLFLILFLISSTMIVNAQSSYQIIKENDLIKTKYKWKEDNNGKQELHVKFKTIGGSDVNVDLELGLYLNGIQRETVLISDCLKRFFWNNWFRPIHLVVLGDLTKKDIESDQFSLEVLSISTEKVEKCIPTHD